MEFFSFILLSIFFLVLLHLFVIISVCAIFSLHYVCEFTKKLKTGINDFRWERSQSSAGKGTEKEARSNKSEKEAKKRERKDAQESSWTPPISGVHFLTIKCVLCNVFEINSIVTRSYGCSWCTFLCSANDTTSENRHHISFIEFICYFSDITLSCNKYLLRMKENEWSKWWMKKKK